MPRTPARARRVAVVVLAAGRGNRLKSARQKVLHDVCGRPSLWYVLRAGLAAKPKTLAVVVSVGADEVRAAASRWGLKPGPVFVDQGVPQGTGHAVLVSKDAAAGADDVVVLSGDDPLITPEHVRTLLRTHRQTKAAATLLTTTIPDPTGYGRIVRDGDRLVEIVEERDASPEIKAINDVACLAYAFRADLLWEELPKVRRKSRQGEFYLHHVFRRLRERGGTVATARVDFGGALGLNSRRGLSTVGRIMRARIVAEHMDRGVTFVDPDTAYVDVDVRIGLDTVIQPLTFLQGATRIGEGASIGPATRIVDSTIGDGSDVAFSVVRGSTIGPRVSVGPYASLRAGTVIEEGGRVGTFVEIKASRVGKGSKVPHLSYVGDAVIGRDSNVGAATVTVNYDGFAKHRTVIGDEVHIGSDTMLVAPVRIGKRAWTGAGSVITKDVPPGALAVERAEQRVVRGYDERRRAARERTKNDKDGGPAGTGEGRG